MPTNENNAKQQIADKIKDNSNILVIVNANPSVDELSAALALTLMINKLDKHGTAIFSGDIPPAISFLDPQKTFEHTVDSLRDFIIALDKEKADHLRYKVEGDVVKIFITPYRTTISDADLEFSQGDYNVELVLAMNVANEADLDKALSAHGKILHDAAVATINLGDNTSDLGSIAWSDATSSSYSEMITSLGELIKKGKNLLDEQISTALLTGIVAATERFSNDKTSSRVMTVAAQLMASGANQQLIATKLQEAEPIAKPEITTNSHRNDDGSINLDEAQSTKVRKEAEPVQKKPEAGTLEIEHAVIDDIDEAKIGDLDAVAEQTRREEQAQAAKEAEAQLAARLNLTQSAQPKADFEAQLQKETVHTVTQPNNTEEPSLGGTLNATTEQAAEDSRREMIKDQNKTILSHDGDSYIDSKPAFQSPLNSTNDIEQEPEVTDVFEEAPVTNQAPMIVQPAKVPQPVAPEQASIAPASQPIVAPAAEPIAPPTLAQIDEQARDKHADAMADVHAAFSGASDAPAAPPVPDISTNTIISSPGALPPLPDFSTLPELPPLPDFSVPSVGPVPDHLGDILPAATVPASQPFDPAQFQIPAPK